jgi:hypothetical protein
MKIIIRIDKHSKCKSSSKREVSISQSLLNHATRLRYTDNFKLIVWVELISNFISPTNIKINNS